MNKFLKVLLVGVAFTSSVYAQEPRTQLMSANEMHMATQSVKNTTTKTLLEKWVTVCLKKEWGSCQVAWWDLTERGGLTRIQNDEYENWGFVGQPDANQVLMHMLTALDNPSYRPFWDMELTPSPNSTSMPSIMAGRMALVDGTEQILALNMIKDQFNARGIAYQTHEEMPTPHLEWLRLLSLMFAIRDDAASSYQVLSELQKHSNSSPEATGRYNETLRAIQAYLKKGAPK